MSSVAKKANSRVTIPSTLKIMSPVQLSDFANFGTVFLPQPAGQVSLQNGGGHDALPASRLIADIILKNQET